MSDTESAGPAGPRTESAYGSRPGTHDAIVAFAARVESILNAAAEDAPVADAQTADAVAKALRPLLGIGDLLSAAQRTACPESYCKHVLYADPAGRFTFLALVWQPGQGSSIHGHTAWGAVGVYEGAPNVACYACEETAGGSHAVVETKDIRCAPGDLATVRPGLCDVHRIYNATDETVITLHAYGRDLVAEPDAINLHLTITPRQD